MIQTYRERDGMSIVFGLQKYFGETYGNSKDVY